MPNVKGFVRTTNPASPSVSPDQRAQLLRKGNELFNAGKYDLAERIFITLKYSDGLSRLGDVRWKQGNYSRAAQLYLMAPDHVRLTRACQRMALVIRQLIKETDHAGTS